MEKKGVFSNSKSQASFEYIILFSLFIGILSMIFYYTSTTTNDYVRDNNLEFTVKTLAMHTNQIGSMSPGTEKIIMYRTPNIARRFIITNKDIKLKSVISGRISDTHYPTNLPVFGFLEVDRDQSFAIIRKENNGVVSINPSGNENLTKGIILYYNFNLRNSTHILDVSGNDNHAEIHGEITCESESYLGNYCKLNDESYLEIEYNRTKNHYSSKNIDDIKNQFTISLWASPENPDAKQTILSKWNETNSSFALQIDSYNINFLLANDSNIYGDNFGTISSEWTHIACSYNDFKLICYVNGEKNQEKNIIGTVNKTTENLRIGYPINSTFSHFKGKIDEVIVWDRALTESEIEKIHSLTKRD